MTAGPASGVIGFLHSLSAPSREYEDGPLLERFVAGHDQTAFIAMVLRHGPTVWGVCQRVLRDGPDAEDAFQATFLVLARKAGSIARPDLLGNWLYGVAYRTAREAKSRRATRRARESRVQRHTPSNADPQVEWADLRPVLDEELNRLPEKFRRPFVLCYVEGKTNEEAARLLNCPKGTVLSRLAWARERLRCRLTRRNITLTAGLAGLLQSEALRAAVPPTLVHPTVKAAAAFAAGNAAAIPIASGVAVLTERVLHAMLWTKVKAVVAVVLAIVLVIGVVFLGRAGEPGAKGTASPNVTAAESGNLRDRLLALEKQALQACKTQDADAVRRLSAKDLMLVLDDGTRLSRKELLKLIPDFRVKHYAMSDIQFIPLNDDAAILLYKLQAETIIEEMPVESTLQVSSTWVRQDRKWLNAFYQETSIGK
jgi:RNA polymerase sigma factor (sigma-70 family)